MYNSGWPMYRRRSGDLASANLLFKVNESPTATNHEQAMATVDQIESAILQLSSDEFRQLREWLAEVDWQRWDEQLEKDVAAGRLDALAVEAIEEFKAGRCRKL